MVQIKRKFAANAEMFNNVVSHVHEIERNRERKCNREINSKFEPEELFWLKKWNYFKVEWNLIKTKLLVLIEHLLIVSFNLILNAKKTKYKTYYKISKKFQLSFKNAKRLVGYSLSRKNTQEKYITKASHLQKIELV